MKNLKMSSGETVQQVKYFPWKREDLSLTPQNPHKKAGHSGRHPCEHTSSGDVENVRFLA